MVKLKQAFSIKIRFIRRKPVFLNDDSVGQEQAESMKRHADDNTKNINMREVKVKQENVNQEETETNDKEKMSFFNEVHDFFFFCSQKWILVDEIPVPNAEYLGVKDEEDKREQVGNENDEEFG